MATELQTDKMPLRKPTHVVASPELLEFLVKQQDYIRALQADLQKLRDIIDTNHP